MTGRAVAVGAMLAVVTLLICVVVFPTDWSVQPGSDPDSFVSPVTSADWAIAAVLILALAGGAGAAGHPWVPLIGCGAPAFVYYCVQAGRADVIGANLWVVGAIVLAVGLTGGLLGAGWLGRRIRRAPSPDRRRPPGSG